jgi:hypothetical protein
MIPSLIFSGSRRNRSVAFPPIAFDDPGGFENEN